MTTRKGILLAGGAGTRLHPCTLGVSKQLLPVYDKPLIYYPLSVLMLAGIRDILIITTPHQKESFVQALGDGSHFGVNLQYASQLQPDGLAQALLLAEDFLDGAPACLILGDNVFWGQGFSSILASANERTSGATIFGYQVHNPREFGVMEFDDQRKVISIEEKPKDPKSEYAVTGLYFYDNDVIDIAKTVKPSKRGEFEITDINQAYIDRGDLYMEMLGRGNAWLDTGTHGSLLDAAIFVETVEKRQGFKIACIEEVAWRNGWLTDEELLEQANRFSKTGYGSYLKQLVKR